ncbi:Uncharacterised protein [Porphyromonas macacae]|uniref:Uncharacterized protein n=1 Tax=Porphyromonas macacae TaxID=28115 RepID=A0A379DHL3_9PORP|nr:Uncharacterised protein [Porphyromonas macacae]
MAILSFIVLFLMWASEIKDEQYSGMFSVEIFFRTVAALFYCVFLSYLRFIGMGMMSGVCDVDVDV